MTAEFAGKSEVAEQRENRIPISAFSSIWWKTWRKFPTSAAAANYPYLTIFLLAPMFRSSCRHGSFFAGKIRQRDSSSSNNYVLLPPRGKSIILHCWSAFCFVPLLSSSVTEASFDQMTPRWASCSSLSRPASKDAAFCGWTTFYLYPVSNIHELVLKQKFRE